MTILSASYKRIPVDVIDFSVNPSGERMATIRARGNWRPFFVSKPNLWTAIKTVPIAEIGITAEVAEVYTPKADDQHPTPPTQPHNLLDLALTQARPQWHSGETVWLWRSNGSGAFLANDSAREEITLNLIGYNKRLVVWWLDPTTWQWTLTRDLENKYKAWAMQAKQARKAVTK